MLPHTADNPGAVNAIRSLDELFQGFATDHGAVVVEVPALIASATLQRAECEDHVTCVGSDHDAGDQFLTTPAVCYHIYEMLKDRMLDGPLRLTCAGRCARQESPAAASPARLSEFTMREIVFLGSRSFVDEERRAWMARTQAFASALGLAGEMRLATDPFFTGRGRGKKLIQQLKELKYELVMDVGDDEPVAVASFNLHETFFGTRFNIGMQDGLPAYSGCVAFGLERWMLARVAAGR